MEEEKTLQDVIEFIIKNSDKTERMDKINKITFPFTSKYNNKFKKENVVSMWYREPSYEDLKDFIEAPVWKYE